MTSRVSFNRMILRAVLRNVSPMVIRVISVPDFLDLTDFDEVFRTVLGWDGLGFIFRVHGQEFNSFRRVSRAKTLRDFQLRPRETFLYTCGAIDLWEWEVRLLDQEPGNDSDEAPVCLGGRGAVPPEHCGGPTGYRLMLKRQRQGEAMCTPVQMEAMIGMFSAADPDEPASTWQTLRQALQDGFQSIDRRLQEYGPLEPERFSLQQANQRLAQRLEHRRFRA
jgi:Plasmid pRiA4b ORF-3-like protein